MSLRLDAELDTEINEQKLLKENLEIIEKIIPIKFKELLEKFKNDIKKQSFEIKNLTKEEFKKLNKEVEILINNIEIDKNPVKVIPVANYHSDLDSRSAK